MGPEVGVPVGRFVGMAVGRNVGLLDGCLVGKEVGFFVLIDTTVDEEEDFIELVEDLDDILLTMELIFVDFFVIPILLFLDFLVLRKRSP